MRMRASCFFVEILLQLKAENIFEYYTKIYLSGEK
ncbi:hypothetical protein HMPREF9984_09520 [Staphylococcus epidermidis NIHLM037]|nr:hypothetical protein HMPREF9984_09520 [Staphylococcus epidermidis NIHLM037]EJE15420.1 hypothetical protein HMPREF9978_09096 [Staphylococcus epidermidis NIHLM015]